MKLILSLSDSTGVMCVCVSVGPSGSSVREISKQTGADIKSWTEKAASAPGRLNRPVRSFVIEVSCCPCQCVELAVMSRSVAVTTATGTAPGNSENVVALNSTR